MMHDWIITDRTEAAAASLAKAIGIPPVVAGILIARGIETPEAARRFLDPELADIPDPFALANMPKAAERVADAVARGETVGIFGDYDADGVTATALLARFLRETGAATVVALPSRFGEGYGLTSAAVDDLAARGATLIVTVDNGTRAFEAIRHAKGVGLDIVVTDHHDPDGELPQALAIVNPKLAGTPPALKHLSGCGVAFMLALGVRRLLRERGLLGDPEPNLRQHLDLVAVGSIADAVELTGANRIFARHGIAELARSGKRGLRALMDVAGSDPARLTPGTVAFQLAPRINAAGRLADAGRAFALLVAEDATEALSLARELDGANRERQQVEERILNEALAMAERGGNAGRAAVVLASENWHVGVVGIVAAKIAERFGRPAVVITRDPRPARGSARSFGGINLVEALASCSDLLVAYGGHAMAAGLSVDAGSIDAFAERLDGVCAKLAATVAPRRLRLDAAIGAAEITGDLAAAIAKLGPFGAGNPEPALLLAGADVLDRRTVGNGHLKLRVRSQGLHFDAIGFGLAASFPEGAARVDLAFLPEFNTFQGITSVQLKLRALRPASE